MSTFLNYAWVFLISMVQIIELRGALPIALSMDLPALPSILICAIGNMVPIPIIYLFARKVIEWGAKQKRIGSFFAFFERKGHRAAQKLATSAGKRGMLIALMMFVGLPLPGTGAWTGTLAASFLNLGPKQTAISVALGVIMASIIMTIVSLTGLHLFGI